MALRRPMEGMLGFCKACNEVRPHEPTGVGACACTTCGTVDVIVGDGPLLVL